MEVITFGFLIMTMSVREYDAELCDRRFCVLIPNDLCNISHGFWVYIAFVIVGIFEVVFIEELQMKISMIIVIVGALQMGGKRK